MSRGLAASGVLGRRQGSRDSHPKVGPLGHVCVGPVLVLGVSEPLWPWPRCCSWWGVGQNCKGQGTPRLAPGPPAEPPPRRVVPVPVPPPAAVRAAPAGQPAALLLDVRGQPAADRGRAGHSCALPGGTCRPSREAHRRPALGRPLPRPGPSRGALHRGADRSWTPPRPPLCSQDMPWGLPPPAAAPQQAQGHPPALHTHQDSRVHSPSAPRTHAHPHPRTHSPAPLSTRLSRHHQSSPSGPDMGSSGSGSGGGGAVVSRPQEARVCGQPWGAAGRPTARAFTWLEGEPGGRGSPALGCCPGALAWAGGGCVEAQTQVEGVVLVGFSTPGPSRGPLLTGQPAQPGAPPAGCLPSLRVQCGRKAPCALRPSSSLLLAPGFGLQWPWRLPWQHSSEVLSPAVWVPGGVDACRSLPVGG